MKRFNTTGVCIPHKHFMMDTGRKIKESMKLIEYGEYFIQRGEKFIVELKIWRGDKYHKDGLKQLKDYLKKENTENGYLLIADKRKDKKFRETIEEGIFTVWV